MPDRRRHPHDVIVADPEVLSRHPDAEVRGLLRVHDGLGGRLGARGEDQFGDGAGLWRSPPGPGPGNLPLALAGVAGEEVAEPDGGTVGRRHRRRACLVDDHMDDGAPRLLDHRGRGGQMVVVAIVRRRADHLRLGDGEGVEQFLAAVDRQQRVDDAAHRLGRHGDHHELVPVRQLDRHHVAGPDASRVEPRRHGRDIAPQLGIAVDRPAVAVDDGRARGPSGRRVRQATGQRRSVPVAGTAIGPGTLRIGDHVRQHLSRTLPWITRGLLHGARQRSAVRIRAEPSIKAPDVTTATS